MHSRGHARAHGHAYARGMAVRERGYGMAWHDVAELAQQGLMLGQAALVQLYINDMASFAAVNAAYCSHFQCANPPARACLQVGSPPAS